MIHLSVTLVLAIPGNFILDGDLSGSAANVAMAVIVAVRRAHDHDDGDGGGRDDRGRR